MLEKLITILTALVAALEANTAAVLKGGTVKKEKADKPADTGAAGATAPTVNDVRAAASAYLEAQKDKAKQKVTIDALNAKYGSKRITEAPAEKFAEIIEALKAATADAVKPAADSDGGI